MDCGKELWKKTWTNHCVVTENADISSDPPLVAAEGSGGIIVKSPINMSGLRKK